MILFSLLLIVVCSFLTFFTRMTQHSNEKEENCRYQYWFSITSTSLFALICLLLVISLFKFLYTANKYFDDALNRETLSIRITLIIFVASLGLRSATFMLVYYDHWPNFFDRHADKDDLKFKSELIFVLQYLIFDILPIGALAFLHHRSFRVKKEVMSDVISQRASTPRVEITAQFHKLSVQSNSERGGCSSGFTSGENKYDSSPKTEYHKSKH